MTEVRWTPQAADDLQAIYDFIGRDSPHYAQVIVEDILAAIDRLERLPLMGRHLPERPREDLNSMDILKQYISRANEIIGERTPEEQRYDREVIRWLRRGKSINKGYCEGEQKVSERGITG